MKKNEKIKIIVIFHSFFYFLFSFFLKNYIIYKIELNTCMHINVV
jgi:hypothetical protein